MLQSSFFSILILYVVLLLLLFLIYFFHIIQLRKVKPVFETLTCYCIGDASSSYNVSGIVAMRSAINIQWYYICIWP